LATSTPTGGTVGGTPVVDVVEEVGAGTELDVVEEVEVDDGARLVDVDDVLVVVVTAPAGPATTTSTDVATARAARGRTPGRRLVTGDTVPW
jgi:hypothetical protein